MEATPQEMVRQLMAESKANKESHEALAQRTGIPYRTLFGYRKGESPVSIDNLRRLAEAMGYELKITLKKYC